MAQPTDVLFIPHVEGRTLFLGMRHDLHPQQSAMMDLFYERKGQVVTREDFGDRLWGKNPDDWPPSWDMVINKHLTVIRSSLPKGFIVTEYERVWRDGWRHLGTAMHMIRGKLMGWKLVGEVKVELFVREPEKEFICSRCSCSSALPQSPPPTAPEKPLWTPSKGQRRGTKSCAPSTAKPTSPKSALCETTKNT